MGASTLRGARGGRQIPKLTQHIKKVKGVTGIEPVTSGSAILRSTAELNALQTNQGHTTLVSKVSFSRVGSPTENQKCQVLPGLEPGLKESESLVITITL